MSMPKSGLPYTLNPKTRIQDPNSSCLCLPKGNSLRHCEVLLAAEFISTKKVYTFSSMRDHIIPES